MRALVAVVAVDEDELAGARGWLSGAGVRDEQVDALGEAEALERGAEVAIELRPAQIRPQGDVEVVRPELRPSGRALARSSVLPPLKRPISATTAPGETLRARR